MNVGHGEGGAAEVETGDDGGPLGTRRDLLQIHLGKGNAREGEEPQQGHRLAVRGGHVVCRRPLLAAQIFKEGRRHLRRRNGQSAAKKEAKREGGVSR